MLDFMGQGKPYTPANSIRALLQRQRMPPPGPGAEMPAVPAHSGSTPDMNQPPAPGPDAPLFNPKRGAPKPPARKSPPQPQGGNWG